MNIQKMIEPKFIERQRFSQWWLFLTMVAIFAMAAYTFYKQIIMGQPFGSNPGPDWLIWLVFIVIGIGLPALIFSIRLIVKVNAENLLIQFLPFKRRVIDYSEIKTVESITYHPIREFGGWGIRGWSSDTKAYTAFGNKGVLLELADGRKVLIGSQQADQLVVAIRSAANI